jgi:hypothetical protein
LAHRLAVWPSGPLVTSHVIPPTALATGHTPGGSGPLPAYQQALTRPFTETSNYKVV